MSEIPTLRTQRATLRLVRQTVARQWGDVMPLVGEALRQRFAPSVVVEEVDEPAKWPRRAKVVF